MVFAPGAGRRPLPKAVAVVFVLVGPLLLFISMKAATEPPRPRILSCTRESTDVIACEPGDLRGKQAAVRRQTGKNAKDCFVLGEDRMWICGGDVQGAAARVNALPVGESADVDLTPPRQTAGLVMVAFLAVVMIVVGARRLRRR